MHALQRTPAWPAGARGWIASGVYLRSPLAGQYVAAELDHVPMSRPHEYAQAALMEVPVAAPVLLAPSQRYLILSALVRSLRDRGPAHACVLIRVYGPDFDIPLPATLLAAEVFLVHDPCATLPVVLASAAGPVVVIDQDLRTDGPERGANRLTVALLDREDIAANGERFAAWVAGCPLLQALSDLRLESIAAVAA